MVFELTQSARSMIKPFGFDFFGYNMELAHLRRWIAMIEALDSWEVIPVAANKHRELKGLERVLLRNYD